MKLNLLPIIFCLLMNCSCKKDKVSAYTTTSAIIDSTIPDHEIYKYLNGQKDIIMGGDPDTTRKKTSAVLSYFKFKDEVEIPPFYFYNNCRAEIINDTLNIRIGTTHYLSDYGIEIKYSSGNYYAVPFSTSDIIDEDTVKEKPMYYLRKRKLALDKNNFKNGDTVYGRIHLEVENSLPHGRVSEYISDGYFRAKIGEL